MKLTAHMLKLIETGIEVPGKILHEATRTIETLAGRCAYQTANATSYTLNSSDSTPCVSCMPLKVKTPHKDLFYLLAPPTCQLEMIVPCHTGFVNYENPC